MASDVLYFHVAGDDIYPVYVSADLQSTSILQRIPSVLQTSHRFFFLGCLLAAFLLDVYQRSLCVSYKQCKVIKHLRTSPEEAPSFHSAFFRTCRGNTRRRR